ncbi:MAG: hypothetical protein HYU69_14555 [Bacteroidetes bacterium]|nr:hypothetical protein [Bacteroidota bacterium]
MNDKDLETEWGKLVNDLSLKFGDLDLQGIIFLIGVQELGKGYQKFKKDEKLEVMHIAICTLLEPYGHYEFIGRDTDGWPHWKINEKLPPLKPGQQNLLMKQAIVDYFKNDK